MGLIKDKIKQQNKEEYAYKKMLSYGWTPDQAAGIVGNLIRESNLNTTILGTADTKGSKGIAQWHSGRLETLQNKYGSNWTDLDNQLDFVNWELNNTHKKAGDKLRTAQGVYNTGRIVSDDYERPKVKFNADTKRQNLVLNTYKKLSGSSLTDSDQQQFLKGTAQRAIDSYAPATNEIPITYTPEVSNLVSIIDMPTLAPENETEAVQKAKEELNTKQQEQINQQRFIQDLLVASQVQYVDPNQVQQEDIYNQGQYFQSGGIKKDNIPNLTPQLPRNQNKLNPKDYLESYLQSPVYIKRLEGQDYKTPQDVANFRLNRFKDTGIYNQSSEDNFIQNTYRNLRGFPDATFTGSAYDGNSNKLTLNNELDQKKKEKNKFRKGQNLDPQATEAHELSHASINAVKLNEKDNFELFNRLQGYQIDEDFRQEDKDDLIKQYGYDGLFHDAKPTENKADLDALRYLMYKKNIYDTRKDGEFKKEHLNKLDNKDFIKNRLRTQYKDEDIIWLMNNIAQNEDNNLVYGQNGGAMSSVFGQTGLINMLPKELLGMPSDKRKISDLIKVKSSLNEGETNYVRTVKPTDNPLKRDKLVEQQASQDFINWYSDPATKEKFSKNTGLDANRLQDFIGKGLRTPIREAETNEDIGYLSKIGADALYTSPYFQQTSNRGTNEKTGEILYQRQRESTPYSKAPNMRSVLGHELSHASNIDAVVAPALQRVLGDVNNQQKGTFKRDREYLSHPEETYGNFHMFRQNLGLKPGQKVDIKQLQQMVKEKGLDEEIFYKAYDDDKIVKAINTIAQNNPETSAVYAQNGGNIPISPNGVYDYPQQEVIVPTDSGLITMKNVNYPILGVDEYGNRQMMYPNQEYQFKGKVIHEIPQLKRTKNKRFS